MLGFRFLWVPSFLVLSVVRFEVIRAQSQNTTIESTAPQIVWSPPLCDSSLVGGNCSSPWQLSDDASGAVVTSTNGPDPATEDIVPQMFLAFQGSAIYVRTSSLSTAQANVTISSSTLKPLNLGAEFNSSSGWITAVGLPDDRPLTLGITYVPDPNGQNGDGGRLDIKFITITVANTSATSSYLLSMTLPTSSSVPKFSHSQTPTTRPKHKQSKGAIIGESLGTVLGVIFFVSAGVAVVFWRRKRRDERLRMEASQLEWGDYERGRRRTQSE